MKSDYLFHELVKRVLDVKVGLDPTVNDMIHRRAGGKGTPPLLPMDSRKHMLNALFGAIAGGWIRMVIDSGSAWIR